MPPTSALCDKVLFTMLLGQTSGMAFLGIIPSGKSCYIFIYGDAKNPWFKRKKVCFINRVLISQQHACDIVLFPHASFQKVLGFLV
jgi:hypothetical protein